MNIVILWELNGIKSTEKQYIITVYQIDTNSISVQVWSRSFIWMEVLVNLESNKQYPTLVQHGAETHIPIQVMSVIALLDSLKFTRFPSKDKSETLSSKYVLPDIPDYAKIETIFEKTTIKHAFIQ